jgi:hypothetical protein
MIMLLRTGGMLVFTASALGSPADAPPVAPPPVSQPPSFSVARLPMSGATARDKVSASFYVIAGKDGIRGINLLPGDLTSMEGKVIAANNYQVTPATIANLDAGQAVLVTVTVGPAAASGTYKGALRLFYQGIEPGTRLELPIEFKATAKTTLELSSPPSSLVVRVTRSFWPISMGGKASAEPAQFNVRQKADATGRVRVALTGPMAGGGPEVLALPEGAIAVRPRYATAEVSISASRSEPAERAGAEIDLPAGLWMTFDVALNAADLPAGTYRGAVELASDWESVQSLPLEVTVRDPWLSPLFVVLVGFCLSLLVTYMATTGSALLQAYRRIEGLQAELARPWLLPSDAVADWQSQLSRISEQVRSLSAAQTQTMLDEIAKAIEQARADAEKRLETIRTRLVSLDELGEEAQSDPSLGDLMTSPWVKGLRARLNGFASDIRDGSYAKGEANVRQTRIDAEVPYLQSLGKALPRLATDDDFQKSDHRKQLSQLESRQDPRLDALATVLRNKGVLPAAPQQALVRHEQREEHQDREQAQPARLERMLSWARDPKNYLPLLAGLISILAVGLLVFTGLLTLYSGKPTFGANPSVDYLGAFVWGLGSEAGRKQVGEIAPIMGALRTRLGITPTPA